MTNYFNDYGNVYCIKFKKRDGLKTDILIWEIDYKGKALFFEGKNFDYLILYDTSIMIPAVIVSIFLMPSPLRS